MNKQTNKQTNKQKHTHMFAFLMRLTWRHRWRLWWGWSNAGTCWPNRREAWSILFPLSVFVFPAISSPFLLLLGRRSSSLLSRPRRRHYHHHLCHRRHHNCCWCCWCVVAGVVVVGGGVGGVGEPIWPLNAGCSWPRRPISRAARNHVIADRRWPPHLHAPAYTHLENSERGKDNRKYLHQLTRTWTGENGENVN